MLDQRAEFPRHPRTPEGFGPMALHFHHAMGVAHIGRADGEFPSFHDQGFPQHLTVRAGHGDGRAVETHGAHFQGDGAAGLVHPHAHHSAGGVN